MKSNGTETQKREWLVNSQKMAKNISLHTVNNFSKNKSLLEIKIAGDST